jgi:gliding motility associated protien GldN
MKKILVLALIAILTMGVRLNSKAQVLEPPPRDGIYDRTTINQMQPIPYVPLREADVIWSRRIWRVVDMREKMNQPFYYPKTPQNGWQSFITIVLDGLKEGTINGYSIASEQFVNPITYKELMDKLEGKQKVTLQRPDNPDMTFDTVINKPFYPEDVKKFRIKEDWVFDKQRSQMEGRILGICPLRDRYDENNNYQGDEPLFWIYFPECRKILAQKEQFNLNNGTAARLSYDDVFMKRMFSSYIYKEENVYDRTIGEYAAGVDALLEAEKAKEKLFEFEHSLWEY